MKVARTVVGALIAGAASVSAVSIGGTNMSDNMMLAIYIAAIGLAGMYLTKYKDASKIVLGVAVLVGLGILNLGTIAVPGAAPEAGGMVECGKAATLSV